MASCTSTLFEPIDSPDLKAGPPVAAGRPLPMQRREMQRLGWEQCDIILITGDAYVDHPSFGVGLIGRLLASQGYRVGIIAQPDIRNPDDFSQLGVPRLFWGITAGNVDSRLGQLTVMRKRRSDDPYSPGATPGRRPANASIAYTACVRQVSGGVPVILGGLEASLRRFAFFDYWTGKIRRAILFDSKADLLIYGMAERAVLEVARRRSLGQSLSGIAGTAEIVSTPPARTGSSVWLPPFETLTGTEGKTAYIEMTSQICHRYSSDSAAYLVQAHGARYLLAHPAAGALTMPEMDYLYGLPFSKQPHPIYNGARIPAFEMIRDSITTHRGCYGGCSFCAIGVHQGNAISSRSPESILNEIRQRAACPTFSGTITDMGGPTANMYATGCRLAPRSCPGRHCLFPTPCPNLQSDQQPLATLLKRARAMKGIRHVFCASGIRPDLALGPGGDIYLQELAAHHVGGRLKIAPEHISSSVLQAMRKPEREIHDQFLYKFHAMAVRSGKKYPVVEYYLSGHPGCTLDDMLELAIFLKQRGIKPEQVQDFYPAPMTIATAMHYTGKDPFTGKPVATAQSDREKSDQRALLLCHLEAYQPRARAVLRAMGRNDLIGHGKQCLTPPA